MRAMNPVLENAKGVLQDVVRKYYPTEISDDEIEVVSASSPMVAWMSSSHIIDDKKVICERGILEIGKPFGDYNREEQEAIISHEIEHYLRSRRIQYKATIVRRTGWHLRLKKYGKFEHLCSKTIFDGYGNPVLEVDLLNSHYRWWKNWLEKWSKTSELYADNGVINRGLGKPLLSALRNTKCEITQRGKKERQARIKNVEEKLSLLPRIILERG